MKVTLLLGLAILVMQLGFMQETVSSNNAPYIYYYSDLLNGVVIERADGADSRVIGQGVMEIPTDDVHNFVWSPSGRWLAWNRYNGEGYATRIDNQQLPWLKQFQCVQEMGWHPSRDLLLVFGSVTKIDGRCNSLIHTFWLVDPEQGKLLASVTLESYIQEYGPVIYWQEDRLQFKTLRHTFDRVTDFIVTLYFDGNVEIHPLPESSPTQPGADVPLPGIRDDGIAFKPARTFDPFDMNTGLPFDPPANSHSIGKYFDYLWHPDQAWVFIHYAAITTDSFSPGRVSIYNHELGIYRELGNMYAWLPVHVPIADLPPGQPDSVLTAPLYYEWDTEGQLRLANIRSQMMSCQMPRIYLPNDVSQLEIWSITFAGERIETVFSLSGIESCPLGRTILERSVVYVISPNGRYLALSPDLKRGNYTFVYDTETGKQIAALNIEGGMLAFNEDSTILYTYAPFASAAWDIAALAAANRD